MAIEAATINIKIPHQADALEQMELAAQIVAAFHEAKEKTKTLCEAMAKRSLTVKEASEIFEAAYPMPSMPRKLQILYSNFPDEKERTVYTKDLDPDTMANIKLAEMRYQQLLGRTETLREMAQQEYSRFDRKDLRGTAWAAYNAVTAVADHREGRNAAESALVGSRAQEKTRAFSAAVAMTSN
jgi:hypothetical protein